jgi:hypothetical protein
MAKVARCEEELAAAREARAALDAKPVVLEAPAHRFATYSSVEEMRAAQDGAVLNPGIDAGDAARAIQRKVECEQSQRRALMSLPSYLRADRPFGSDQTM